VFRIYTKIEPEFNFFLNLDLPKNTGTDPVLANSKNEEISKANANIRLQKYRNAKKLQLGFVFLR
jgi:hypothetical protein